MNLSQSPADLEAAAATELLRRRAARSGLLHFTNFTFPQYRAEPAHELIARTVDQVVSGQVRRLMIFAPPQHGKSELVSVRLPAFWLAKRPDDPVLLSSYAADLAYSKSRQAREIVESEAFKILFPGTATSRDSRAVNQWQVAGRRGFMKAVGVGGPVTGHGGPLGIIDDPFENWEQAQSQTHRDRVWDWYRGTFRTRIWEGGAIVLIMCMTGDTPVLMADGTESPLREIKVGDQVATYDNGRLATSTVRQHRSNGLDSVFRIKTTCGKIVYANERHPFLVKEHGQLKWIRLRDLTTAHRIVTVRDSGANGRARRALLTAVRNLLVREAIALRIMAKRCGRTGIALHRLTQSHGATHASSIGTASPPQSMMPCSRRKTASALSASSLQETTCGLTGPASCALTTATKPTRSEGFCATTATLRWGTPRQRRLRLPLSNTSDFTSAAIAEIEPAGVEEVFDIQIERTENFIANGLVSHNTRWHEDDLAGRLLEQDAGQWTVLRLPAMAESQAERDTNNAKMHLGLGLPDPLGRQAGEALCPGRYSSNALQELRTDVGSMVWSAEYQAAPTLPEGGMFKREWFRIVDAGPAEGRSVRYWDKAGSADGGDYSAGVKMVRGPDNLYYITDVVRGQWSSRQRNLIMEQTAELDGIATTVWVEQEPGSGGKESAELSIRMLAGFAVHREPVSGEKWVRAMPLAAQCEAGNVRLVRGAWNGPFIEELTGFPTGTHDDQVDAASGAFNKLARKKGFSPL